MELTDSQWFMGRLGAIFSGKFTPDTELYEPLEEQHPLKHEFVCKVTDSVIRELASLCTEARERAYQTPMPRKPAQLDEHKRQLKKLYELVEMAAKLMWEKAEAVYPQYDFEEGNFVLLQGWVIAKKRPSMMGHPMMRIAGMQSGLMEHLIDEFRRKHEAALESAES